MKDDRRYKAKLVTKGFIQKRSKIYSPATHLNMIQSTELARNRKRTPIKASSKPTDLGPINGQGPPPYNNLITS